MSNIVNNSCPKHNSTKELCWTWIIHTRIAKSYQQCGSVVAVKSIDMFIMNELMKKLSERKEIPVSDYVRT